MMCGVGVASVGLIASLTAGLKGLAIAFLGPLVGSLLGVLSLALIGWWFR